MGRVAFSPARLVVGQGGGAVLAHLVGGCCVLNGGGLLGGGGGGRVPVAGVLGPANLVAADGGGGGGGEGKRRMCFGCVCEMKRGTSVSGVGGNRLWLSVSRGRGVVGHIGAVGQGDCCGHLGRVLISGSSAPAQESDGCAGEGGWVSVGRMDPSRVSATPVRSRSEEKKEKPAGSGLGAGGGARGVWGAMCCPP